MRSYLLSRLLLLLLLLLQYYSRQFLEKVATKDLGYHVAVKDVKTEAGTVKGLKLEKFIFDAFPYVVCPFYTHSLSFSLPIRSKK